MESKSLQKGSKLVGTQHGPGVPALRKQKLNDYVEFEGSLFLEQIPAHPEQDSEREEREKERREKKEEEETISKDKVTEWKSVDFNKKNLM